MRNFLKAAWVAVLLAMAASVSLALIALSAKPSGQSMLHGLDPTVTASIVAAVSSIVVAIGTLGLGRIMERKSAIDAQIRDKKVPVYSSLISGLYGLLSATPGPAQQSAAQEFFTSITPEMMTWASDDVVVAWSRFKRKIGRISPLDLPFELERVLIEIRKDYGHRGRSVKEGDLLGLFITDIDQALENRRSQRQGGGSVNSQSLPGSNP